MWAGDLIQMVRFCGKQCLQTVQSLIRLQLEELSDLDLRLMGTPPSFSTMF